MRDPLKTIERSLHMFRASWARCLAAVALLAAVSVPVGAAPVVLDFEPLPDLALLISPPDKYLEKGYRIEPTHGDALVDASFCDPITEFCAVGNLTTFMTALNDAELTITSASGEYFQLLSFDASFFPSPFLDYSGAEVRLRLSGNTAIGGSVEQVVDLQEDGATGNFLFGTYVGAADLTLLRSLTLSACFVDGTDCLRASGLGTNDAQFAIDNLALNRVPEPPVAWLVVLSLAGMTHARRRTTR